MDTAVLDLPAPTIARLRSPGWRDPRLLVGIALVAVATLLGAWAVRSAQDTVAVFVVQDTVTPGTAIEADDLRLVEVHLPDEELAAYVTADADLSDVVVQRTVLAGELLPRAALGSAQDVDVRPVAVPLRAAAASGVEAGASVDVWFTPKPDEQSDEQADPYALATGLIVAEVDRPDRAFGTAGAGTVQVLVPVDLLPEVLAALASDGSIDVVPLPGQ
ncbi:hypothetical protein [Cellulomonas composti]|uniref:Flagellar protein FlgA n=1 Tax=Cellulomonas composti TaxID=266130 RepID=A0A511JAW5_9CELL|nr:hypothetical protein [Cellulomonas composti]GEL95126.1 flagellar protein FlgA [Cellulomonas composti]